MSKRKIDDTELQKTEEESSSQPSAKIAPIFLNASAQKIHGTWRVLTDQLMIYTPQGILHRSKIAGFDMDGTLIKTKSGRVFPLNNDDWQFWSRGTIGRLRRCHEEGFKLCIFTNQMGIQKKHVDAAGFKIKIQNICTAVGVPIQVFVSIGTPNFRKPYTGMWDKLVESENGSIGIEKSESFYVGDAAGRTKNNNRPKSDHSCVDRLFAMNLGLKFYTPEQFFFPSNSQIEEDFLLPKFNSLEMMENSSNLNEFEPENVKIPNSSQELILLVGPPACGKSTFSQKYKDNYVIINQDELKTWQNCFDKCKKVLENGSSVIVDNTNRGLDIRKKYCDLAKSLNIPCRCFIFDCSLSHSLHNNEYRKIIEDGGDEAHKNINEVVIKTFFAGYKEPKLEEGFDEIIKIRFKPNFQSEQHRRIYGMYLIGSVNV
ncbi:unnamed protein product [Meloidogyne enterolobii]|uniref:Uncharacterized protein n=1 Tax=Meloidogyne enterolobii TaxID=390850 RepID=A0ACB1B280_MELEN